MRSVDHDHDRQTCLRPRSVVRFDSSEGIHGDSSDGTGSRGACELVPSEPQRSAQLFDIVQPEAYYSRPIALRHPIVFYEGHLPAFSLNTLVKKGLGRPGVDERARAPVRARHRSGRRGSRQRQPARRMADARRGPALRRRVRRPRSGGARERAARAARASAAARGPGRVRDPRARGDAPGNDALHVASAAVRAQAGASRRARTTAAERRRRPGG